MSDVMNGSAVYPAPVSSDGDMIVLASVATARAATQLEQADSLNFVWYEFFADGVDVFLTFGDSSVAAPSATATSGDSRSYKIPAGETRAFAMGGPGRTHFRDIESSTGGYLRVSKASPSIASGLAR